jgi:DNA-binding protein HU-beta
MTKTALISDLKANHDFKTSDAEIAVEAVFGSLQRVVASGSPVRVPGFGTFSLKTRAAREGRNPATGEKLHIAAKTGIAFKPAK